MKKVWILLWICSWTSFLFGQEINSYEYWLDTNNSNSISTTTTGNTANLSLDIDVSSLSEGIHFFNFRAKDSKGFWSSPVTKYFYHVGSVETNEIVSYEYWLDTNYTEKKADNYSGSFSLDMDVTFLSEGIHFLNMRFKDKRGYWSSPITHYFYHFSNLERNTICGYEYWFDTNYDGKQVGETTGSFVNDLDVKSLPEGIHYLNIRFKDTWGLWSNPITHYFYHNPVSESNQMVAYEYWVDESGFETRTQGTFEEDQTLVSFNLDVEGLAEGEHVLFFRAKDIKGQWSSPLSAKFRRAGDVIIPTDELAVLKNLYNSTNGKNWTEQWNVESTMADTEDWKGVSFDEEGHVVGVNVSNNNLVGELPKSIFSLPYLTQLCLDGNALTGELNTLMAVTSNTLKSVSLKQNQFTGSLPSLGSWTALTHLDVSYCYLKSVEILPESLVENATVVPQYMNIPAVELRKSVKLELPDIVRFKNNSYDESYPKLQILDIVSENETNRTVLTYDASSGNYQFSGSEELKIRSGVNLVIESTVNTNKSRSETFQILFDQGDVDASGSIDISDVVATANRVLERSRSNETLFNFYAADTYKDNDINIQDIVRTTEIILEEPVISMADEETGLRSNISTVLTIKDGYIVLNTTNPIMGVDISLNGVTPAQVRSLVGGAMFTIRQTKDGCRFVLLAMGDMIPVGETKVAVITSENALIRTAILSDEHANRVPVTLQGNVATGIERTEMLEDFDGHSILVPEGTTHLSVVIYNLTGQIVWKQSWNYPLSGSLDLTKCLQQLQSGGYILSRQMKIGNSVISKNNKLIIN